MHNETNDLFPLLYWEGISAQTRPAFCFDLGSLYPNLIKQCAASKETVLTRAREPGAHKQYIFLSPFYAQTDKLHEDLGPMLIPRGPYEPDTSVLVNFRGISAVSIDIDRLMELELKRLGSPEIAVFLYDENDHTPIFTASGGLEERSGEIEVRGSSASIEFLNARWVLRLVDSSN